MAKETVDFEKPLVPDAIDQRTTEGEKIGLQSYDSANTAVNSSGKATRLPVADLVVNPANPRNEAEGDYDVDGMIASYRHNGCFIQSYPVTVSKRADGTLMVLKGNRRVKAAQKLAQDDPAEFKRIFPDGKVPAVVLTGLTLAEEITGLIDHGREQDRKVLSPRGEMRAIRQLLKVGIRGRDAIARALNLYSVSVDDKGVRTEKVRSSYIQPRLALLTLPVEIQEKMLTESSMFGGKNRILQQAIILGKDGTPGLVPAQNEDRQAGNIGPDGFGPTLRKTWNDYLSMKEVAPSTTAYIPKAKVNTLLGECDSAILTRTLNFLGGFAKDTKMADLDALATAAETAQVSLTDISDFLGASEFAALCEKAFAAGDAKRKAAADEAAKAAAAVPADAATVAVGKATA